MTDVFISYSRLDSAVAVRLCDALIDRGKSVFIDVGERLPGAAARDAGGGADERARAEVAGILPSAPWMEEIQSAIAAADTVLVVVSPDSCTSPICLAELEFAKGLHKRLIPVRVRDTPAEVLPAGLAALNLFDLGSGQEFDSDVDQLVAVLDTDIDGLRQHTRLTVRAHEWDSGSRDPSLLLSGKELSAAEQWLTAQSARTPTPTVLQAAYIDASRAAATRRHRIFVVTAVVLVVSIAALTSAAGFEWQSSRAQHQATTAQRKIAARQHAMAFSRELASDSNTVDPANHVIARRLAVAAWHVYPTEEAGSALAARLAEQQQNGMLPVDADDTHSGGGDIIGNLAFRPDGQLLATDDFSGNAQAHNVVRFWNPLTRQAVGPTIRFGSGQDGFGQVMFTPDGKFLAAVDSDGMRLWDPVTGRPVTATLYVKAQLGSVFAPRGDLLAAVDSDGGLRVWHLAADRPVGAPLWIRGNVNEVGVAFSPDGKLLATNVGGKLQLWNPDTGRQVGSPLRTGLVDDEQVTFSPDGKSLAAVGSDHSFLIWHLVNGHPAGSPREISSRADVDKIAFGGGSNLLAVGYTDGTIRLWNPTTGHPVGHLFQVDAISDMAFSPTGKILATTGSYSQPDDGTVELWDPTTGRPFGGTFQTGAGSHGGVRELAFSLRGGLLAVTDNDGTVEQWDTLTGHSSALYEINPRRATIGAAFSPGGQLVACALNSFGGVVFWDLVTGRPAGTELRSGHQEGIQGVAFSSDGKLVATSGEGTMLWNRANGQSVGHFLPSSSETAVAFSPHSQLLATAGDHGTVQLWNSATERSVRTFQTGSQDTVHEVAFSPDGTLLASADSDGTVRMWNTVTGHPVGLPIPAGSDLSSGVSALAFTPDGTLLATVSGATGTVRLWNVSLFANPYAALCADAGPPTRQEWNQYAPGEPPAKACS